MSDRAGILERIRVRVAKMLGPDASPAVAKRARGEAARFLGVASGAAAEKKRRRKIAEQSKRRNR